ncbi:hypothetical protein NIES4103_60920 [Nostoc sp. NIES-4103]|nr:hypothetical protein NIES4103_60920 [Nostoc sp. NIES-4103]
MLLPLPRSRLQVIMDLEKQIQLLIDNAPPDGVTPHLVAAIAPTLSAIAQKLRHSQYYILQSLEGNWVLTTLSNRANPGLEKRVVYAFSTIQDVSLIPSAGLDPQIQAKPLPVTHILFQLMALEPVDSIVFLETPGTTTHTVEVQRDEFQKLMQQQIKPQNQPRQIPPDIA